MSGHSAIVCDPATVLGMAGRHDAALRYCDRILHPNALPLGTASGAAAGPAQHVAQATEDIAVWQKQ